MQIPKKMKAAILVEQKQPLVIDDVSLPSQLSVGQVLVKIFYSGICGSQLGEIDGAKGEDKYLPHLLGHEASGEVIAIGPGVKSVKPNDRVVLHWRKGQGIDADPPVYEWHGRKVNAGWLTTFNEFAIVSENRVTVLPDDADMDIAALFGCAVTTGFGVIENNARVKMGESIVVFGAGGIGLNIVQAAAMVNAYPIIAVDLQDNKLALAKQMGATYLINSSTQNAHNILKDLLGHQSLDVFVDNTGNPSIIELGYALTHKEGRVILVGVPKIGNQISIYTLPLHFGKVLQGSHGGESTPEQDINRYYKLYTMGKMKLKELITHALPLNEINDAITSIRNGSIHGRCLIKINSA